MINKYGLFYTFINKNDQFLTVYLSDVNSFDKVETTDDLRIYYHQNEIAKIDILTLQKYVKIHINGLIYFPTMELIALINGYLGGLGCLLNYKNESGFTIRKDDNNQYIVIAKKDTFIGTCQFVKEDHVCSYKDLDITDSDEIFFIEEKSIDPNDINKDFFKMEEKEIC